MMRIANRVAASAVVLMALSQTAFAQQAAMPMNAAAAPAHGAGGAADQAMMQGMKTMNDGMAAAPMTGDPDKDFVAMMIPHHQGAVAMAKVELEYGKDPAMRKLAHGIIAAQDREIAQMKAWQAKHKTP
jgi:uncharacterized protein (DUF305 family)